MIRGASRKPIAPASTAPGSTRATSISARRPGLARARRARAGPRARAARFSPSSGTTSATVASATRSRSSSAERGSSPARLEQRLRELVRDAGGAQVRRTGSRRARGCTIGASGSAPSARGAWWSVTTTSSPAARAAATSSTAVIAQSTVISRSVPRAASRSTVAGGEAVAVVDAARQVPVDVGAERAQRAHEHGRRAHAVDVVVAVDGDPRAALDVRRGSAPRPRAGPPNASSGCALLGGEERARAVRRRRARAAPAPARARARPRARPPAARRRRSRTGRR